MRVRFTYWSFPPVPTAAAYRAVGVGLLVTGLAGRSLTSHAQGLSPETFRNASATNFQALALGRMAQLSWVTASELENTDFIIERLSAGTLFAPLDTLTGLGSTTKAMTYRYLDGTDALRLAASRPLYYRLCQVDVDGTKTYSPIRLVSFKGRETPKARLQPNPAGDAATLNLRDLPPGSYQAILSDLSGRVIETQPAKGGQEYPLNLRAYKPGYYAVQLVGGTVKQFFFLQRK
jgi:hypothetical protein